VTLLAPIELTYPLEFIIQIAADEFPRFTQVIRGACAPVGRCLLSVACQSMALAYNGLGNVNG
jgi:hypothetical protein